MERKYKSLKEFYPFYLTEHSDATCRAFHFVGTTGFFILLIATFITGKLWLLALLPVVGYGCAWIGHFVFEKNKPATFQYPLYSFASDFIMYYHILTGQIGRKLDEAHQLIKS